MSEEVLASIIADSASKFINNHKLSQGVFAWLDSASAFSVSKSDVDPTYAGLLNTMNS